VHWKFINKSKVGKVMKKIFGLIEEEEEEEEEVLA
jgi:hypothetical protein